MTPFNTRKNEYLRTFAHQAHGPFSFLDAANGRTLISCTAFFRVGNFTGHRLLCSVLAEDFINPRFGHAARGLGR